MGSAANSVPSGPNVIGPTDVSAGPSSGTDAVTGVRAVAQTATSPTAAIAANPLSSFTCMFNSLLGGAILQPLGGVVGPPGDCRRFVTDDEDRRWRRTRPGPCSAGLFR